MQWFEHPVFHSLSTTVKSRTFILVHNPIPLNLKQTSSEHNPISWKLTSFEHDPSSWKQTNFEHNPISWKQTNFEVPSLKLMLILQRNYKLKARDNNDSLILFLLDFPNLPFSPSLAACERPACTGRFWSTAQSAPEPGWWTSCSWQSWGDRERSPGWPDDLQPARSGGAHSSECSDQPD